jgi:hypothetical protein
MPNYYPTNLNYFWLWFNCLYSAVYLYDYQYNHLNCYNIHLYYFFFLIKLCFLRHLDRHLNYLAFLISFLILLLFILHLFYCLFVILYFLFFDFLFTYHIYFRLTYHFNSFNLHFAINSHCFNSLFHWYMNLRILYNHFGPFNLLLMVNLAHINCYRVRIIILNHFNIV